MQGGDSTLTTLYLRNNEIDDEGVAILVDALQNNTKLTTLDLRENDGLSTQGQIMLLKLVNDISSIKSTLQSNHTLKFIHVKGIYDEIQTHFDKIHTQIDIATQINMKYGGNPEAAGREKVIQTQLNSVKRAELADLQGLNRSLYSEINPLHLPEVLARVGRTQGQGELYAALSSSIMTLFSTVNRKKYILQQKDCHASRSKELDAELVCR